jgi:hypothetical protein
LQLEVCFRLLPGRIEACEIHEWHLLVPGILYDLAVSRLSDGHLPQLSKIPSLYDLADLTKKMRSSAAKDSELEKE